MYYRQRNTGYVQPQIVIFGNIYDTDFLYFVTEGSIICQISQEKIVIGAIGLLDSFNILTYHTPNIKQSCLAQSIA